MYIAKRDFGMGGVEYKIGDEVPINDYRAVTMMDEGYVEKVEKVEKSEDVPVKKKGKSK